MKVTWNIIAIYFSMFVTYSVAQNTISAGMTMSKDNTEQSTIDSFSIATEESSSAVNNETASTEESSSAVTDETSATEESSSAVTDETLATEESSSAVTDETTSTEELSSAHDGVTSVIEATITSSDIYAIMESSFPSTAMEFASSTDQSAENTPDVHTLDTTTASSMIYMFSNASSITTSAMSIITTMYMPTMSNTTMLADTTTQFDAITTPWMIYIISSVSSVTISTVSLITATSTTTPSCKNSTHFSLSNGTCISKADAQELAVNILHSNTTNSTVIADALSLYISSITNSNVSLDSKNTLSIDEIDTYLDRIDNIGQPINTNDSILMAQPPYQANNTIVLGASFTHGIGGEVIKNTNKDNVISSSLSAAAIISNESLSDVTSLKMLIINKPSPYRYIDNSTNKTLASSIIFAILKRYNSSSISMNISLYFKVIDEWKPNTTNVEYYCSFYDTYTSQWNESGCTKPIYNQDYDRYECSCNHLTSFALIWLPNVPPTTYLTAQDIASLVFQSISILCFLVIITHAIFIHVRSPLMSFRAYDLLPLISSASTTILFIFYIALGMTVYTKTSSSNQKQCFLSSSVLMFFVYFFLIFMFCTKTSVGYFNYLRFVRLFPQPSRRRLFSMLVISFFISVAWVAFAAGFNSNSSFQITKLYPYKLCWFTRNTIHYFLTIPVCLFLLINIVLFILVAVCIINHVRRATSPHQSYERMKICVLVLLSSCLTQGIGWIFAVFIGVGNSAAEVLGWFFVIFNGFEGFWAIIIYIIIQLKYIDDQKRIKDAKKLKKMKKITSGKYYNSLSYSGEEGSNFTTKETDTNSRNVT